MKLRLKNGARACNVHLISKSGAPGQKALRHDSWSREEQRHMSMFNHASVTIELILESLIKKNKKKEEDDGNLPPEEAPRKSYYCYYKTTVRR